MTQRRQRLTSQRRANYAPSGAGLGLNGVLIQNAIKNIKTFISKTVDEPLTTVASVAAFVATLAPIISFLFGSREANQPGQSSIFNSIAVFLSSSTPMKLATSLTVALSVGWTWAMLASWLTKRSTYGAIILTNFIAGISGFLLTAWCMGFLLKSEPAAVGFGEKPTMLITAACICGAALMGRIKFELSYDSAIRTLESRATALLIFTLCAVVVPIINFMNEVAS